MLKQRFPNTCQLDNDDIDKFKLLLTRGVYPYVYMDSWDKFDLPIPLDKKRYYSELNDSNISDEDINHVKNVCNTLKITNLQ